MRPSLKPFLRIPAPVSRGPSLGRSYSVLQETWRLRDDPKSVPPKRNLLATRKTASDAADTARASAAEFSDHGFHKASGAWWGSDGVVFHRFVVTTRRPGAPVLLAASLAGGLALALWGRRSAQRRTGQGQGKRRGNAD